MTTVAELSVTFVELPFVEGAEVRQQRLRLFSSLDLAERWLREHLDDTWEYPEFAKEARVLWFTVLVGETDIPWDPRCIRFDARGQAFDDSATASDPWTGRPPESCAFAPGDSVLCVYEGHLTRGAVQRRPLPPDGRSYLERTDDTYLVLFQEINEDAHEHTHEQEMWRVEIAASVEARASK